MVCDRYLTAGSGRFACAAVNQGTNREVEYSGRELLDAVRGPCQQRGIRCTDVDGFLVFEHM